MVEFQILLYTQIVLTISDDVNTHSTPKLCIMQYGLLHYSGIQIRPNYKLMYLDVHQSFFTDTFDTARFTTPCLSTRCPPTRFVPMYNVLNFDWLMQQEMQIQKFLMNYTLKMTSQRKLEMGKEIRDKQQQFLIVWGILVCRIILPRTKVRVKLLNALGFLPNSVYL